MSVEIISDEIGIQPELAEALIRVSESVSSEHGNMMVPNSSIRALMEVGAHGYAKKLADEGVNPDRISFMRVQGLHRRTMSIPAVYDPDLEHTVCVLDHSPENEGVVVEPFMSAFAPVDSMSSEVDMVIPSGETVFTDAPWVGSISEYLNGSFMAWDSSSHSV